MADSECKAWEVTCHMGDLVGQALDATAGQFIKVWVDAVLEAIDKVIISLGTAWMQSPAPPISGSGSMSEWVQSSTGFITVAIATGALIIAGIQLMMAQRGEDARRLAYGVLLMTFSSGFIIASAQVLVGAGDAFATWILAQAGATDGNFMGKFLEVSVLGGPGVPLVMTLVLGLVALLASLVQFIMLLMRSAMLVLLVGLIPLASAASVTGWGREWLKKMLAWIVAFILFKPLSALIYAVGIKLMKTGQDDSLYTLLLGVVIMVAAVFALPALVSFLAPAASAMGGGGMMGASMMGAASLANGAVNVSRMGAGGGSDAQGGTPSPSGATPTPGATGAAGASGPSGAAGAAGGAGAAGAVGGAGAAGAAGAGAAGAAGAAGSAGAAGASAVGGAAAAGATAATGGVAGVAIAGAKAVSQVASVASSTANEAVGGQS